MASVVAESRPPESRTTALREVFVIKRHCIHPLPVPPGEGTGESLLRARHRAFTSGPSPQPSPGVPGEGELRDKIVRMSAINRIYQPHALSLLTDLYQLTMAYGYWKLGMAERRAAFHL